MTVAIRTASLIDGTGADPQRHAVVLVDDGVITGMRTRSRVLFVLLRQR